ncbi:PH domain-containing protein [Parvibaculum sp.]|uniref:PH domain-containing protein n=1 Tax=Parvibaculum sp. TaxID=2024848 RepID=UPI00321137A7
MNRQSPPDVSHFGAREPLASAVAHWTIYLPAAVVAAVWLGIFLWATFHAPQLSGLRALSLAVLMLGTPALAFAAALRARLLSVEIWPMGAEGTERAAERELVLRDGFAMPRSLRVGAREIASIRVRRSLPQRLFGGGALDIRMLSGERVLIADIDQPDALAHALAITTHHTHAPARFR